MNDLRAWIVGAVGLAAAALGWVLDSDGFYAGWLAAFTLLGAWSLGSLALLLIHALTGGRWGDMLRPALVIGVCALPLLLPALLPLLAGLSHLYVWARPGAHLDNGFYLNADFFAWRGVIYLVTWFTLAALVLGGFARLAAPGLFVLALTFTFATTDTTMSLDPHFSSSIYGMIAGCGAVLLALSVAILLSGQTSADLGKLLLALVVLWTYLDFMQLLIVWQSDLADEAPWYLARFRGFWGAIAIAIAVGHFALPFAFLLAPKFQRSRRVLVCVAFLLIATEVVRSWWTVLPAFGRGLGLVDIACVAGLGGVAYASARWLVRQPVLARGMSHV